VLLYDGVGNVTLEGDASVARSAAGRLELRLAPASGFTVRVVATSAADPLRAIRVVPAPLEANYTAQVFAPGFLSLVAGGGSCRLPLAAPTSPARRGSCRLAPRPGPPPRAPPPMARGWPPAPWPGLGGRCRGQGRAAG
jgi:hypothetical protein